MSSHILDHLFVLDYLFFDDFEPKLSKLDCKGAKRADVAVATVPLNFNLTRYLIFTRDGSNTTNSLYVMPVFSGRSISLPLGIFRPSGRTKSGCG